MKQLQLLDIYIPYSYMTEELMLLPLHIAPPHPPPPELTNTLVTHHIATWKPLSLPVPGTLQLIAFALPTKSLTTIPDLLQTTHGE